MSQFIVQRRNSRFIAKCLVVLWPLFSVAQTPPKPALPSPAPAWSLPVWTAQGPAARSLASSELQGQWIYLDFWASWCGPCKQSFPWMQHMQEQLRDHQLQVVAVGLDKQAMPMEQFLKPFPNHVLVVWDPAGETAKRYDVTAMPSSYLINPTGQVVWSHRGFQSTQSTALIQTIRQHMAAP